MRYLVLILFFPFLSCNVKEDKAQQATANNVKPVVDTITIAKEDSLPVDSFNITKLIPAFSKDTAFHHISGMQVGREYQKTAIYNVYSLPRKGLFDILQPKKWKLSQDPKQEQLPPKLLKIDSKAFFTSVYREYENNPVANRFYDQIKALKKYEIFVTTTYGYIHWIFIDKNSDTVYHRSQAITY